MTAESREAILSRVAGGTSYDLSVEYFIGMPSWQAAGDPHYRIWMTHTPNGTVNDDPLSLGRAMNEHVSYTGAAVSMYTHMGTHIDSLNHFGLNGKIWNGFSADEHLGDRGWKVAGAENIPPIIARGVLIDVAAAKGVDMLADGYRVTRDDLVNAVDQQGVELRDGDVVLIRTGRMNLYENASAYMANPPGLGMAAARFLVEESGAMIVGADNLSFEAFPSEVSDNYVPLHTYLLARISHEWCPRLHLGEGKSVGSWLAGAKMPTELRKWAWMKGVAGNGEVKSDYRDSYPDQRREGWDV